MKQIQKLSEAENFSAINLGRLSDISDYVLELGPGHAIHLMRVEHHCSRSSTMLTSFL